MPIDTEVLQSLPLLRGLTSSEVEELAVQLEITAVAAGESIIREGDPPGHPLFILLEGSVEVIKRGMDGRGHVISSLSAPSVFGEIEALARRPAIATVNAVTAARFALLKRGVFDEMCTNNRPAALKMVKNLAQVLSHRLAATDERLAAQFNLSMPGAEAEVGELRRVMYSSWRLTEGS